MAGNAGGAFTGLYQGSSGASDAAAALAPLLPNISVYQQGPSTAAPLQAQVTTPSVSYGGGSALDKFGAFLGGVAKETGNIAGGAASWLAHNALNLVESPIKLGEGIGHGIVDQMNINSINSQTNQLNGKMSNLLANYKSGRITKDQYVKGLNDLGQDFTNLNKQSSSMVNKVTLDKNAATSSLLDTASLLVTILTAGAGTAELQFGQKGLSVTPVAAKSAADWLTSKVAEPILDPVINSVGKIVSQPEVFKALDASTQEMLQRSTAEVISQSASTMTAGQIAKATAVNVALKYPIYFNMFSGQAHKVYQELDQHKYGAAIQDLAFQGALLLSGGPIAHAFKFGGKLIQGITDRTFGQTAFWDELGKLRGDASAYTFAISKRASSMEPAAAKEFLKNMSAVEVTNVHAAGGDASLGASRIFTGMKTAYGLDMKQGDVNAQIDQFITLAQDMRLAQETATKLGLGPVVVGRWDTRVKSDFADAVLKTEDTQAQLDAMKNYIDTHPNEAIANNDNLQTQLRNILTGSKTVTTTEKAVAAPTTAKVSNKEIQQYIDTFSTKDNPISVTTAKKELLQSKTDNPAAYQPTTTSKTIASTAAEKRAAILKINARTTVEGFPKPVLEQLAKNGHVPIQPKNLKAPFVEGTGELKTGTTVRGNTPAFFTKAVQPVPILSSVGSLFTKIGLSPQASTQKAYEYFNSQVAENLKGVGIINGKSPEEIRQASDTLIKDLSNYAKGAKLPVQDLRMLNTHQISKAMEAAGRTVTPSEASAIQKAIVYAHIQVPLTVRGMGDAAVDWTYGIPGTSAIARRYYKVQNAARFSWNPFFQYLRVIPKTEILSTAEGGGYINAVFQGRAGVIEDIRHGLRSGGLLDTAGHIGSVEGAEAIDSAGMTGRNLTKHLLPMQERSIAGLIDAQARRMGMNWQDYIRQFPHQAADTIQMIAQYDRNSSFLNSPLARTLNIAFFPFRFDAKVATIMGRSLARTSPITQVAVVNGMMQAHAWLNSPEGQAWYSQNASAIGLFNYITPLATMAEVMTSLLPGHDHSLGNFGELGGLPFGWIPQLLDAEGITHFNQAGVDAKTGQAIPSYVPVTARGQAAIAIQDFVGSLFSYPGAMVGLPSKTSLTRSVGTGFTGANKSKDLQLVTPNLSADQQQYQRNVQAANGTEQQPLNTASNPSGTQQVTPSSTTPNIQAKASTSTKAKAKKKSQYTPYLLPGQSQLGVI